MVGHIDQMCLAGKKIVPGFLKVQVGLPVQPDYYQLDPADFSCSKHTAITMIFWSRELNLQLRSVFVITLRFFKFRAKAFAKN